MNSRYRAIVIALALLAAVTAGCQGAGSSPGPTPIDAATVTDDWLEPLCKALGYGGSAHGYLLTGGTSFRSNDLDNAAAAGRLAKQSLQGQAQALDEIPPWEPGEEMVAVLRDMHAVELRAAELLEGAEENEPEAIESALNEIVIPEERMQELSDIMAVVPGYRGCL